MDWHILPRAVVVIPADADCGMGPHPINHRLRIGAIFDEIAGAEADIEWLTDRFKGVAIGVDIGEKQYPHACSVSAWYSPAGPRTDES
jgi:hypothetical protein